MLLITFALSILAFTLTVKANIEMEDLSGRIVEGEQLNKLLSSRVEFIDMATQSAHKTICDALASTNARISKKKCVKA
jgi:hypothetical protein